MIDRLLDLSLWRLGLLLLNRPLIIISYLPGLDFKDGSDHSDWEHVPEALFDTVSLIYLIRVLNEHLGALYRHLMLLVVHALHLSQELRYGVAGLGRDHEA